MTLMFHGDDIGLEQCDGAVSHWSSRALAERRPRDIRIGRGNDGGGCSASSRFDTAPRRHWSRPIPTSPTLSFRNKLEVARPTSPARLALKPIRSFRRTPRRIPTCQCARSESAAVAAKTSAIPFTLAPLVAIVLLVADARADLPGIARIVETIERRIRLIKLRLMVMTSRRTMRQSVRKTLSD